MREYKDIFVFVEQKDGEIASVGYELISEARKITAKLSHLDYKVVGVLLGDKTEQWANEVIGHGADRVICVSDEKLKNYTTQYYTDALMAVIDHFKPDGFLIGATVLGRDLAPRLAARADTGLTADATMIEVDTENPDAPLLLVTRPAFGGNLYGTIVCPRTHPQMATIRPNVFEICPVDEGHTGEIESFKVKLSGAPMLTTVETIEKEVSGVDITKAKIILSVGRGMQKHLDFVREVAKELGATVACSRAVVDAGYAPKELQVGQTGKTVRPNVYIACGISGAAQHMAGMEKSDYIIAINTDPNAAIFLIANLGLVGDGKQVLTALKSALLNRK